jgi:hypothetical protein
LEEIGSKSRTCLLKAMAGIGRRCFQTVLDNVDDGPSKYFMSQIKENKGVPPKDFLEYGLA